MILNIFARYSSTHASTRVRFLQFLPALRAAGFDVRLFTIIKDSAVRGNRPAAGIIWLRLISFFRVLRHLSSIPSDSLLHVHIEVFPWVPYLIEHGLLRLSGVKNYSIELDDAWFHQYELHRSSVVRFCLGSKIDRLMKGATVVIAGNQYIAARAIAAGACAVTIVPTVVDADRYVRGRSRSKGEPPGAAKPLLIGWIGSPATTKFLVEKGAVIENLHNSGLANFVAIGADAEQLKDLPIRVVAWNESDEARALHGFDIGIMPLTDSAFERGKCGYKLIQYMACGLPVVASPVGVNSEIVLDRESGFLASDDSEWITRLSQLCTNADWREKFGAVGLQRMIDNYSVAAVAPQLVAVFLGIRDQSK